MDRVEKFFQDQNGGKDAYLSTKDGETFTAMYVINFAKKALREIKN